MNRMIRGMAGLMVALGVSACGEDPSVDFGGDAPTQIQASPTVMFVTQGVAEPVLLRLVDDRNRSTATSWEISNVSAGLSVELDDEYRPDFIGSDQLEFNPIQHQHRYFVTGNEAVSGSFTVSSGGFSEVITVRVVPSTIGSALSSTAPALGEPIVLTAPANLSFSFENTPLSAVTVGGVTAVVTDRTAKTITFVPFPGSVGPVSVTNVTMDYSPTLAPRTLTSNVDIAAIPAIPTKPTLSATSPALGDQVTVTAGAGQEFSATANITFPAGGAPVILSRTATTITFLPRPGTTGVGTVSGVILTPLEGEALGTFSVQTTNSITVPAVTVITGTFSNAAPAAGATTTFSAPGFKFLPTTQVRFGTKVAAVTAISADSSTITILPPIGVTATAATITNSVLSFLTAVPLAATPTSATLTTPGAFAAPALPNTNPVGGGGDPAAPTLTVGTSGAGLFDGGAWTGADAVGGGGPNRWYKLVVTGATVTRPISLNWEGGTADFDFYVRNAGNTAFVGSTSASAGSSQPETQSISLAAGTYWVVAVNWSHLADPSWVYLVVQ